jgi:arylsulfatase A-like enzyme
VKLAGGSLDQPLPLDGCDIWPVLVQGEKAPRDALFLPGTAPGQAAIRQGDWKLLSPSARRDAAPDSTPRPAKDVQLYNLARDLGESHNVAGEHPQLVQELAAKLAAHQKDAVRPGDARAAGVDRGKRARGR